MDGLSIFLYYPPMSISANLRVYRERRALSRKALADLAAISPATIFNIENGASPSVKTLDALAAALGIHPADLLAGPTPSAPTSSVRRGRPAIKRTGSLR